MKKVSEKLRKRDRALNAVKSGAKRARKFYQKIQPKLKPLINPRSALFGFILISILKPTVALAAVTDEIPFPNDSLNDLPGWKGNISTAIVFALLVEESTFHASSIIPGSKWFNSRIAAPVAALGTYACVGGGIACHSVGWHNKGWKCMGAAASCTGYVVGAHRAAPDDPVLQASRVLTSPFENYLKAEQGAS